MISHTTATGIANFHQLYLDPLETALSVLDYIPFVCVISACARLVEGIAQMIFALISRSHEKSQKNLVIRAGIDQELPHEERIRSAANRHVFESGVKNCARAAFLLAVPRYLSNIIIFAYDCIPGNGPFLTSNHYEHILLV